MPREKILVVDDELLLRVALEKVLTENGFEVNTCASGKEALFWLEKNHYDLALVDIRLPDCNGLDLLKEIKKVSPKLGLLLLLLMQKLSLLSKP